MRRGYSISPIDKSYNHRTGIAISVRGHSYPIEIHEMTDTSPLDENEAAHWRRANDYRLRWNPTLKPRRSTSRTAGFGSRFRTWV